MFYPGIQSFLGNVQPVFLNVLQRFAFGFGHNFPANPYGGDTEKGKYPESNCRP